MKLGPALASCLVLAACGGGHKSSTIGNTGGSGGGGGAPAGDLWGAVMKKGATFTVDNWMEGSDEPVTKITATVTDVIEVGDARIATIQWMSDWGEGPQDTAGALPRTIAVSPKGVWFGEGADHPDGQPTFPASGEVERDGSSYTVHDGELPGEKCFNEGPGEGAGECEDVCFAELCVDPVHGITGGAGTWWPNYVIFSRPDLRETK